MMKSARFLRLLLVPMIAGAWVAGVTIASERSASSMANAATKFLASLTDEQRKQANPEFCYGSHYSPLGGTSTKVKRNMHQDEQTTSRRRRATLQVSVSFL